MTQKWEVIILGCGFAGLACAKRLQKLWGTECTRRVLLVSAENYFLFQPLLPEVVGAGVNLMHVINPIRLMLRRCTVRRAEVTKVDLERLRVEFDSAGGPPLEPVCANHLVLALGSGIDMRMVPGMMEHGLFMKTLADAMELRLTIIRRLEESLLEPNVERRRSLLHFVVVGGGYSGVETAGQILDMAKSARRFYRSMQRSKLRVTLVHSGQRLLPELDDRLGHFAERSLERRGMELMLNRRVNAVSREYIVLNDGSRLEAKNVVCTVGNAPHPVLRSLPVERSRGRVVTDEMLRVKGHENVWAVGDCSENPNGFGGTCPPTAQFATRLGSHAARNIDAALAGRRPDAFRYKSPGQIATIGYHNGVCSLHGVRFSGFAAWWLTQTIHLLKLPGLERKIRLIVDWTLEVFFPRNINYVDLAKTKKVARIHLEPGDVLYRQGERGRAFYLIEQGSVEMTRRSDAGEVLFTEELEPGSHFGERSLLLEVGYSTTAVAKTPVTLLAMNARDFNATVENFGMLRQLLTETSFRYLTVGELGGEAWPEALLARPVAEVMSKPVVSLPESATIADALQLLAERRRGNLPLISSEGTMTGLVTKEDLYRALNEGRDLRGPVGEIATRRVTTLRPDESLREAMGHLRRSGHKQAPVVDVENRLVGLLSLMDLGVARIQATLLSPQDSDRFDPQH